jgi:LuxR family transcriptional regulator, maltose regulon positive regulatory protein
MSGLLLTKLFLPPLRSTNIVRSRLLQKLDENLRQGKILTLVSAPAGYGKSMLVAEWLRKLTVHEDLSARVGWLSLDETDSDPTRFFNYLAAAVEQADPAIGQSMKSILGEPQQPSIQSLMTSLINDLTPASHFCGQSTTTDNRIFHLLVLDDYHKIKSPLIHEAIQFLLDHSAPHFHLVIITREDPPLRIPKMRARLEISEIRAQDLRFTQEEMDLFLNKVMQLNLTQDFIHLLFARTEGWAVGIQLAALSLQGRSSPEEFMEDFQSNHRYIIDYLMNEVLDLLPEETRHFLNHTSILDRFNAPLCQAVTGRQDSEEILRSIEQSNLFLIPLDERREWYRYHHLFSDFLQLSLNDEEIISLHQKASQWFESNGYLKEAIEHGLASKNFELAADLINLASINFLRKGELSTVLNWLNALPNHYVAGNGNLLSSKISCLYFTGLYDDAFLLMDALDKEPESIPDPLNYGRLLCMKAWTATGHGEDTAIKLAEEALSKIGDKDLWFRTLAQLTLGHGYRQDEEFELAACAYKQTIQTGLQVGQYLTTTSAYNSLAFLLNEQGKRHEAVQLLDEAAKAFVDNRGRSLPMADLLKLSLSILCYEHNEINNTIEYALTALNSNREMFNSRMISDADPFLIQAYAAQGNCREALNIINEVRQHGTHLHWIIPPMDALEAEISLRQGKLDQAIGWADKQGLAIEYSPTVAAPSQTFFTYSRLLLALNKNQEAKFILSQMEGPARRAGWLARLISISILKALAAWRSGERTEAVQYLDEAVRLAAPGGYIRRFLDEGEETAKMVAYLDQQQKKQQNEYQPGSEVRLFIEDLHRAFSGELADFKKRETLTTLSSRTPGAGVEIKEAALVEPLSEQEIKILRLLSAGLSNQEIAAELFITVGTAKWHVHNIYGKLGVANRMQAAARAQDLFKE